MCRNIRTLFNFEPAATDEEIQGAALQYVRKVSGFATPSKVNEAAFRAAVEDIAAVTRKLVASLSTNASPRNREESAAKARARFRDSPAETQRRWKADGPRVSEGARPDMAARGDRGAPGSIARSPRSDVTIARSRDKGG